LIGVSTKPNLREYLDEIESEAWDEYLQATKDLAGAQYREVESWAWAELVKRLGSVERRRAVMRSRVG
jgi:hypothetical protein